MCRRISSRCRTCSNFLKSNGTVFSNSHTPIDRAHGRRQPHDLHRPLRRPARPAGDELVTRRTTRTGRPTRRRRSRTGRPRSSTRRPTRRPEHDRHDAVDDLLGQVPATRAHEQDHAGAVGAVHPRRLHGRRLLDGEHGARERGRRHPDGVRRRTRPRRTDRRGPGPVQGRPRSPTISVTRSTAPRATRCATRRRSSSGRRAASAHRHAARPSRAATAATRRSSARSTSRPRSAADAERDAQRLPGHGRERATSSTSTGTTLTEAFSRHPGFPGLQPDGDADARLLADMQEAGIPVTYGYISDLHEKKADTSGCTTATATAGPRSAPATPATSTNAQHYDAAFQTFFQRLATDGITPANTLFVISAEENDQFAGANVGRATAADAGRLRRRHRRLQLRHRADRRAAGEHQGPAREHGQRGHAVRHRAAGRLDLRARPAGGERPDRPPTRARHRGDDRRTTRTAGVDDEKIVEYQAGALEQRVLHMQTADPLRTPTYTLFPKPDYFFSDRRDSPQRQHQPAASPTTTATTARTSTSPGSAFAGPGVAVHGVDGPEPARGTSRTT